MSGEEICGISTEQLEAMTDEQLLEFFKDILPITRPEPKPDKHPTEDDTTEELSVSDKPKRKKRSSGASATTDEMFQKLLKIATEKGILK